MNNGVKLLIQSIISELQGIDKILGSVPGIQALTDEKEILLNFSCKVMDMFRRLKVEAEKRDFFR
jgi:hypothetical protein